MGYQAYELRLAVRKEHPQRVLVDTAYAKSVMGEAAAKEYANFVKKHFGQEVKRHEETEPLRFGPSKTVWSAYAIVAVLVFGKKVALVRVSVIKKDVPCLISKGVLNRIPPEHSAKVQSFT
jgi:hypothetical protein